jgi:hypothetical protein
MSYYQSLAFPRDADTRRHERHSVKLDSRVRELGAPPLAGTVKEVSVGGCRLNNTDLPPNAEIWVTLGASRPMRARVVWVARGEAGCEFYAPLTRAELRQIMLQQGG